MQLVMANNELACNLDDQEGKLTHQDGDDNDKELMRNSRPLISMMRR